MSFWFRRCSEQSRTPKHWTVPKRSARICTSRCRPRSTRRSMNSRSFPATRRDSSLADVNAPSSSSGRRTGRIPRPPPVAAALIMQGSPSASSTARASVREATGVRLQGTTGTPADSATSLAAILSPRRAMAADVGPRNTTSRPSSISTKRVSSDKKPQPAQTAVHPVASRASRSSSRSRYGDRARGLLRGRGCASAACRTNGDPSSAGT